MYGFKALKSVLISHIFLEKLHMFLRRKLKKKLGKVWFRVIPFFGVTKKPLEVRMGKGKGGHELWCYQVKKGQIFMELTCFDNVLFDFIFRSIYMKFPFKTKLIRKK